MIENKMTGFDDIKHTMFLDILTFKNSTPMLGVIEHEYGFIDLGVI